MSQYSLFAHGNSLQVETPANLAGQVKVGWGSQIHFRTPVATQGAGGPTYDNTGPGSWLHLPLPSTLTTFGRGNPQLVSVTLLVETIHCRITNVHVYDGASIVEEFNNLRLKGSYLWSREPADIDPEAQASVPRTLANTLRLRAPHRVFSAIGLSFYACAFYEDFNHDGWAHQPQFHGPFPPSVLIVSGGGGQFTAQERSSVTFDLGKVHIKVDP
jgi:hypothetical protein